MITGRPQPDPGRWLFPRALFCPGWLHVFDNVLSEVVNHLDFFPAWLQELKGVIGFCRSTFIVCC
jgi:hypothetical protein